MGAVVTFANATVIRPFGDALASSAVAVVALVTFIAAFAVVRLRA